MPALAGTGSGTDGVTPRQSAWYPASVIAEDTWGIVDHATVNCYLVLGRDRALLIDTGYGRANLRDYVRSLTSLPLTLTPRYRAGGSAQVALGTDQAGNLLAAGVVYYGFTPPAQTTAPFDNPLVREAISLGIDRQRLLDNFAAPGSEIATHFTPCAIPNGCTGDPWPVWPGHRSAEGGLEISGSGTPSAAESSRTCVLYRSPIGLSAQAASP